MIQVQVPEQHGPVIVFRHAGDDPVTYEVVDGHVQVHEHHLDVFLATFSGAKPAPPAASAEPAAKEK